MSRAKTVRKESSLLYFYTGALTIGFCIVGYFLLLQLPISKEVLLFLNECDTGEEWGRVDVENGEATLSSPVNLNSNHFKPSSSPAREIELTENTKLMKQYASDNTSDYRELRYDNRTGSRTHSSEMSPVIARSFPLSPLASPIVYNLELERRQSERKRELDSYEAIEEKKMMGIELNRPSLSKSPVRKSSSDNNLAALGSRSNSNSRGNSRDNLEEYITFSQGLNNKENGGSRRASNNVSPATVPIPSSSSSSSKNNCSGNNDYDFYYKIAFNESMVFLLFFSTLLCWPGLVTEIPSHSFPQLVESDWWSLLLLFIFSLFDCIGRYMVPYRMGLNKNNIWIPIVARFLLIPLLVCVVNDIIESDLLSVLIVIVMGYTNGYLGTLSILLVNDCCSSDEERAKAGMLTGLILNTGLVLGSTAALGFQNLVTFR